MAVANADDPQGRQRRRRSVSATAAANADGSSAVAGANDDKAEAEAGTLRGALEAPVARSMAQEDQKPAESKKANARPVESTARGANKPRNAE